MASLKPEDHESLFWFHAMNVKKRFSAASYPSENNLSDASTLTLKEKSFLANGVFTTGAKEKNQIHSPPIISKKISLFHKSNRTLCLKEML